MAKPRKNKKSKKWYKNFDTIWGIVMFLLLVGFVWAYISEQSNKEQDEEELNEEEQKEKTLAEIKERIKELTPQKAQLIKTEKNYLFVSRLLVGMLLVTLNGLYLWFDNWKDFSLGDQLNINAAIALVYSFLAFILFGNPTAFAAALKMRITKLFLKKKIHVFAELEKLQREEKELISYFKEVEETKKLEKLALNAVFKFDANNNKRIG